MLRVRERCKVISRKIEHKKVRRHRTWRATLLLVLVALPVAGFLAIEVFSPWPLGLTLRHLVAAPSCDRARTVHLAPAFRGEPGYWARHDRDGDGISCEFVGDD